MWDTITGLFGLKYLLGLLGSTLITVGALIEPSAGIWIVAIGGTLLSASFGKDRSLHGIIIYIAIGIGWGIFASQLLEGFWPFIPQRAFAFFASMFGAEVTWYCINSIREGSITNLIVSIVTNFKPVNFNKDKKL